MVLVLVSPCEIAAAHPLLYAALRQHALTLRSNGEISWALVLSLRATVLCVARNAALQSLVYPAVHVVLGFIQSYSNVAHIPTQLLLLDCLLLLSNAHCYVPVAAAAVRALHLLLTASPASGGGTSPHAALSDAALRVTRGLTSVRGPVRDTLASRLVQTVARAALLVARHVSFPEWAVSLSRQLRYLCRYASQRPSQQMHALAGALDANARHVLAIRGRLRLTPHTGVEEAARALQDEPGPFPIEAYAAKQVVKFEDFLESRQRQAREETKPDQEENEEDEEDEEELDMDDDDDVEEEETRKTSKKSKTSAPQVDELSSDDDDDDDE